MKKYISLVAILVLSVCLIGCGTMNKTKDTAPETKTVAKQSSHKSVEKKGSNNHPKKNKKTETKSVQASKNNTDSNTKTNKTKACFDRDKAVAVFDAINAERAANGVGQLTWDESIYSFACIRAQQIVANFAHDDSPYGENIHWAPWIESANDVHMAFYNSPGHHQNYLYADYLYGAVAVYVADNGSTYSVELFSNAPGTNGESATPQPSQQAQDYGSTVVSTWTASNGIVFEIFEDGNIGCSWAGYTEEQLNEAIAEFAAYMGYAY